MNTEEKMNAIRVINKEKDRIDYQISRLEAFAPQQLLTIEVNEDTIIKPLSEDASRKIWHILRDMLVEHRAELIKKAEDLMK